RARRPSTRRWAPRPPTTSTETREPTPPTSEPWSHDEKQVVRSCGAWLDACGLRGGRPRRPRAAGTRLRRRGGGGGGGLRRRQPDRRRRLLLHLRGGGGLRLRGVAERLRHHLRRRDRRGGRG